MKDRPLDLAPIVPTKVVSTSSEFESSSVLSSTFAESEKHSAVKTDPALVATVAKIQTDRSKNWNLLSLFLFRFFFIYFSIFSLDDFQSHSSTLLYRIPGFSIIVEKYCDVWTASIQLVAKTVFHISREITFDAWVYSDNTFGWLRVFCILIIALCGAIAWSAIDRKRKNYSSLQEWFRLLLRLVLAQALITYGMSKVFKNQFSDIGLSALDRTYGEESPMGLLWMFMGYSSVYCLFGGLAEVIPAVLLLFRRFTLFGALLAAAVMTNVFMLNLCYDVRVKLYSMHLLIMALVLIAPDLSNLLRFFLLNRATEIRKAPNFFRNKWINYFALALPVLLGLTNIWQNAQYELSRLKANSVKSPYYGIWRVIEFNVQGQPRVPSKDDHLAWQTILFETPDSISTKGTDERMNTEFCQWSNDQQSILIGKISNYSEMESSKMKGERSTPTWTNQHKFDVQEYEKGKLSLKCSNYWGFDVQVKAQCLKPSETPKLLQHNFRWITEKEEYMPKAKSD